MYQRSDTMLTANQKYIDTANIKHLLSAGEKNADKIQGNTAQLPNEQKYDIIEIWKDK